MPTSDIGDVLEKTHRLLKTSGIILDIHPRPRASEVEIRIPGHFIHVGYLDETGLIRRIHDARREIASMIWDGFFNYHDVKTFDFLYHFDSVEECIEFLGREWEDSTMDRPTIDKARKLLGDQMGEIIIRQPLWAATLKRL